MIRIGIDARFFGPKQKGLGRYVQMLVEHLGFIFPQKLAVDSHKLVNNLEFVVFLRKENFNDFEPPAENFKKVLADWRWYTFAEQIFMPYIIWQEKIGLMHFPHFNVPVFCPTKFVVTIHDLVLKRFPTKKATTLNPLLYKIKELGYKLILSHAVKKSQKIIVPSNFTKNEILNYFKIKPEKIAVIYEGAPQPNFAKQNLAGEIRNPPHQSLWYGMGQAKSEILKKYNIVKPYILYVGNAYPHKNLEGLILAFAKIVVSRQLTVDSLRLVLVGEIDYFYKKIKRFAISNLQLANKVVFTGFVPDEELPELYKNAVLYVSPAFSEGFGLPSLEAMSYGVPVVGSSGGAQKEILGEAALYFNPYSADDMAEKISAALKDENLRNDLISREYEQIKKYSWQKMAEKTLEIYRNILKPPG